jgi:hypothetical protein
MSTSHFLVFVGASPTLSTELQVLKHSFQDMQVIAPAAGKRGHGISDRTVRAALEALALSLGEQQSHSQVAKLTVWAYRSDTLKMIEQLWNSFGRSGWIELVPTNLLDKIRPTRLHIQNRIEVINQLLHEVSHQVYARRKASPFSIPLSNFKSQVALALQDYWYQVDTLEALKSRIEKKNQRFRQFHTSGQAHHDDRSLIFSPALDTECHGMPHPIDDGNKCFVNGRFRFGAALFPGFHYDVRSEKGLLNCTFVDCMGAFRDMRPEKRKHLNIFPNDHLLPK